MNLPVHTVNVVRALAMLLAMLAAFFLAALQAGAADLTEAQARLYQQASDLYATGNYARVRELLETEVMAREKPHSYACSLYGLACMEADAPARAVEAFRRGLAHKPDDFSLRNNLALALMRAQRHGEAGEAFLHAAQAAKESRRPPLRYSAAQCFYLGKNYARAEAIITPLADNGTAPVEWLRFAAAVGMHQGKWAVAENYFARLVRREPAQWKNWRGLAHVRERRGNKAGAVAAMEVASRLPQSSAADRKTLAGMYLEADAPLLSLRAMSKAAFTEADSHAAHLAALNRAGRDADLIRYLDGVLEKSPEARLYLLQGIAYYRLRDLLAAQRAFAQGGALGGQDATQCRLLEGFTAWERNDLDAALTAFATVRPADPRHSQARQAQEAILALQQGQLELLMEQ